MWKATELLAVMTQPMKHRLFGHGICRHTEGSFVVLKKSEQKWRAKSRNPGEIWGWLISQKLDFSAHCEAYRKGYQQVERGDAEKNKGGWIKRLTGRMRRGRDEDGEREEVERW